MDWPNLYGDYSFIVMSATKAFEFWLFKLAKDLNIDFNSDRIGVVRDQIERHLNSTLDNIEKKIGDNIKTDIAYLKNFIQEYRNDIVHCKKKIDSPTLAKNKVLVIFERMNSVTEKLINAGILKVE